MSLLQIYPELMNTTKPADFISNWPQRELDVFTDSRELDYLAGKLSALFDSGVS